MKAKAIISLSLCLTLAFSFCACLKSRKPAVTEPVTTTTTTTTTTTAPSTTKPTTKPYIQPKNDDSKYKLDKYSHLSSYEKEVYDTIIYALENGEETIEISGEEMKEQVFDKVFYYSLVVGRRSRMDEIANQMRGQKMRETPGLSIVSYDRLVDNIKMLINGY